MARKFVQRKTMFENERVNNPEPVVAGIDLSVPVMDKHKESFDKLLPGYAYTDEYFKLCFVEFKKLRGSMPYNYIILFDEAVSRIQKFENEDCFFLKFESLSAILCYIQTFIL